jgi:hypothetical protein
VRLSGAVSSQYLSALLMAAPLALGDVEIVMIDKLVSVPYVDMTLKLMERFGVKVERHGGWERFSIKGGQTYKLVLLSLYVHLPDIRTDQWWFFSAEIYRLDLIVKWDNIVSFDSMFSC